MAVDSRQTRGLSGGHAPQGMTLLAALRANARAFAVVCARCTSAADLCWVLPHWLSQTLSLSALSGVAT
jgi:hypothetical protein